MPHITVEYTANINRRCRYPGAVGKDQRRHDRAGHVFPSGGIRSRAIELATIASPTVRADDAFVHVTVKIGAGRYEAVKKRALTGCSTTIKAHFAELYRATYPRAVDGAPPSSRSGYVQAQQHPRTFPQDLTPKQCSTPPPSPPPRADSIRPSESECSCANSRSITRACRSTTPMRSSRHGCGRSRQRAQDARPQDRADVARHAESSQIDEPDYGVAARRHVLSPTAATSRAIGSSCRESRSSSRSSCRDVSRARVVRWNRCSRRPTT